MLVIGLTAGVRYTYYACFNNVDNHVKMLNVLESTVWVHLVILTSNLYAHNTIYYTHITTSNFQGINREKRMSG